MTTLRIAGGRVLTPELTVEASDVLVDQDAGEIVAIGTDLSGDSVIDADGGLVMPGLVNAHTHVSMTLFRGYADDTPLDVWLREDIWPVEAELTAADIRTGAALGVLEMIKTGTIGFCDMYFEMAEVADVVETAGVRAVLGRGLITIGKDEAGATTDMDAGLTFAKTYDGVADGRVRTAFMPHSLTTVGQTYLDEYVPRARDAGVPIHLHANETHDEVTPITDEYGVRPLEYARSHGLLQDNDFIAHGVHVDTTEIELLAETGTGVVHCPASNAKLASGMAPVQEMLDAGVTVGLGTDGAASNNDLDMFGEIRDAAMIGKLETGDARSVSAESAVRMATAGSANILGFESGQLVAGANADLIVVDLEKPHLTPAHDLVSHLAYAVRGSDVRHTICDGVVLMEDRVVQTIDEQSVIETARQRTRELLDRVTER